MYSHEDYIKFQNHYVKGLKSINQKTYYPSVSIGKQLKAKLETTSHSFNAFYNIKGMLIHIVNLHPRSNNKYSYFYDKEGRVVKILEINKKTDVLLKENKII